MNCRSYQEVLVVLFDNVQQLARLWVVSANDVEVVLDVPSRHGLKDVHVSPTIGCAIRVSDNAIAPIA